MKKKMYVLFLILSVVFVLAGCGEKQEEPAPADDGRIKAVVSFDAMKELTEAVGGDKVSVTVIIPDGTEPHDFELKADDIRRIGGADVFVYNGLGMEPWAEKAIQAAGNSRLHTAEASRGAVPVAITDEEEKKEHGAEDPHLWLSPKGAELEAANIRDALIEADPGDREYFTDNYDRFHDEMESLYAEYRGKFAAVPRREIVTGHAAFAYLCRDFDLTQNSAEDVFASGEPGTRRMTELVDYCQSHQVKTIFAEDLVNPAVAQILADEAGAKVQKIYTMESSEEGKNFVERMKDNLQTIYEGLE